MIHREGHNEYAVHSAKQAHDQPEFQVRLDGLTPSHSPGYRCGVASSLSAPRPATTSQPLGAYALSAPISGRSPPVFTFSPFPRVVEGKSQVVVKGSTPKSTSSNALEEFNKHLEARLRRRSSVAEACKLFRSSRFHLCRNRSLDEDSVLNLFLQEAAATSNNLLIQPLKARPALHPTSLFTDDVRFTATFDAPPPACIPPTAAPRLSAAQPLPRPLHQHRRTQRTRRAAAASTAGTFEGGHPTHSLPTVPTHAVQPGQLRAVGLNRRVPLVVLMTPCPRVRRGEIIGSARDPHAASRQRAGAGPRQ